MTQNDLLTAIYAVTIAIDTYIVAKIFLGGFDLLVMHLQQYLCVCCIIIILSSKRSLLVAVKPDLFVVHLQQYPCICWIYYRVYTTSSMIAFHSWSPVIISLLLAMLVLRYTDVRLGSVEFHLPVSKISRILFH